MANGVARSCNASALADRWKKEEQKDEEQRERERKNWKKKIYTFEERKSDSSLRKILLHARKVSWN